MRTYRSAWSIYTDAKRMRQPHPLTVLYDIEDWYCTRWNPRSRPKREPGWWAEHGRRRLTRLHIGSYGTWRLIRTLQKRKMIRWE